MTVLADAADICLVRHRLIVATALATAAAAPALAGPAAASASGCPQALVLDWADDGRVDAAYSVSCYRAALATLPLDLESCASAPDDIRRSLAAVLRKRSPVVGARAPPAATVDRRSSRVLWSALAVGIATAVGVGAIPAIRLARRLRRSP